ncbi:hypothetical protein Kpol_1050p37 [Vanderwaltozyma polyspora DSM 70294]|uniref:Acyl-CoA thioesterase II n=1 Tax=Vanderwaltozyma polyspora (strain ATCC 22028 / DSM 70294 / BCRC 21397 / CBS 2163 / NBRC 10782 / NRRL Y-8283 / UCD 57-17) TaxID=436907 RepID=A7TET4_VANPO|nr:uncharacterized protein Kpol_1050p37 [Vanderwaltozyma polyspora DSM 70294]EDO19180.1 hypothetical protein Kpol_1050p37 [Vanderwaltozyma polyspora DSM 70294]
MNNRLANLERILELTPLSASRFVTSYLPAAPFGGKGTFGGTLVAQALLAALYTVPEDFEPTSLHGYFVNAGNPSVMIQYHVSDLRHGRNFIHKQVKGYQHEKVVYTAMILFSAKKTHDSLHHFKKLDVSKLPKVSSFYRADELFEESVGKKVKNYQNLNEGFQDLTYVDRNIENFKHGVLDYRFPKDLFYSNKKYDLLRYYINCRQHVTKVYRRDRYEKITPANDPRYSYVALAYLSDSYFLFVLPYFHNLPIYSHKFSVSLDHSIHFHQQPDVNDFLLFEIRNPRSNLDKHLMEGEYFSRKTGEIVASVVQEGYVVYDREEEIRAKF